MDEENLKVRLLRAKSWIKASRALKGSQQHEQFIFRWIAFNCLYGRDDLQGSVLGIAIFLNNIKELHRRDIAHQQNTLLAALERCRTNGAKLIEDRFSVEPYYLGPNPTLPDLNNFLKYLARQRKEAETLLGHGNYEPFLALCVDRLRFLRNQIFHGNTTHGQKSKGWNSLVLGVSVLKEIVPAFVSLVKRYGSDLDWGETPLPRWGSRGHARWLGDDIRKWGKRYGIKIGVKPTGNGYRILVRSSVPHEWEDQVARYISRDMGLLWEPDRKEPHSGWRDLGIITGDPAN